MLIFAMILATLLTSPATMIASPLPIISQSSISMQSPSVSIQSPPTPLKELFDEKVNQWIDQIAKQPEFSEWHNETLSWERHPIGPGIHGWVVIISNTEGNIGYLIVSINQEGHYALGEYGVGEYPLYSENTLYQSLIQHELIPSTTSFLQYSTNNHIKKERIYFSPLQHFWLITIGSEQYHIEAKTGELIPLDRGILTSMTKQKLHPDSYLLQTSNSNVVNSLQLPSFDPYYDLSWVKKSSLPIMNLVRLKASLQKGTPLTYVANIYDETMIYAFSVTGYHEWNSGNNDLFISLDQDGTRFILAQFLSEIGHYYPVRSPRPSNDGDVTF